MPESGWIEPESPDDQILRRLAGDYFLKGSEAHLAKLVAAVLNLPADRVRGMRLLPTPGSLGYHLIRPEGGPDDAHRG